MIITQLLITSHMMRVIIMMQIIINLIHILLPIMVEIIMIMAMGMGMVVMDMDMEMGVDMVSFKLKS